MTDVESRTFRVSAEETFEGWPTTAADIKEGPMNIYINAETIYSKAPDVFYTTKVLSNDKSYVTLYPAQTKKNDAGETSDVSETFIELYSNGMISTGKYIVYKYRIPTTNSRDIGSLQLWTSTENPGAGGSDYIDIRPSAMQADGQWHVLVVDVAQLKQEGCVFEQNEYGAYVPRYLRVDVTNAKMNAGDYIDIGYVGFSDSLDEIFAANADVSTIDLVDSNRTGYTSISAADHEASKNALIELGFESTALSNTNTFTLDLKLESISTDVNLLRVIPQFDFEKFELVSVENGTLCTQMSKLDGSIIWNTEDAFAEAGTLARFTFRTKETIEPGEYEFGVKVVDAFSTQVSEVTTSTKSGIVTILDDQLGDCDGDNKVSVMDVTLIRKYIAAYNYETGESSVEITKDADVNLDGVINSLDISLLRKYLANYDYETNTPGIVLGKQN